ncbi:MAG: hypothetical protein KF901_11275 [Myxococcales bacterium]|nr:hypothetical protein [Myxococcales bacterium]
MSWRAAARAACALVAMTLFGCGDDAWNCETDDGARYDLRVVRMTLDVTMEPTPVPEAEVCSLVPRCACLTVDEGGRRSVRIPPDLEMLLEVRAPGYFTTVATHRSGEVDRASQLVLIDRGTMRILAASVGLRLDPQRGHVGLRAAPGPGRDVTATTYVLRNLDTGEEHPFYYTARGAPSLDATSSDETGLAVAVNVPPGNYRVESDVFPTCNVIDAGWPFFVDGRFQGLDFPIHADSVTLLDALDCGVAR